MQTRIFWGLVLAGACSVLALGNAADAKETPATPKLVVVLSVDQFSSELYERYRSDFKDGLKRLSDGVAFASGYQSHAATETCPGHSTILTGRHPYATGVVANNWLDMGERVYCVSVDGEGKAEAGPQRLLAPTLGDWLKSAKPKSQVVSISGKDRAAIMLAGHHADAVYWWTDDKNPGFATSKFAGPADEGVTTPAKTFNDATFAAWRAAPPALWPQAPEECAQLQKPHTFGQQAVSGRVPPDMKADLFSGDFVVNPDFQKQLRASPALDALTLKFAGEIAQQRKLGRGPETDILAISLSATDYIGHRYGNGGAESCTQILALDRALGDFLKGLDSAGVDYLVTLTADHGAVDAAERVVETQSSAQRVDPEGIIKSLNKDLKQTFGLSFFPIAYAEPQQLYLKAQIPAALRTKIRTAAIQWLQAKAREKNSGVSNVYTSSAVAATPLPANVRPDRLSLLQRYRLSYYAGRSGDIIVNYKKYASLGKAEKPEDAVAGHGSAWDYDRRVPILFWRASMKTESRAEPIQVVDIAPTLAAMIGLTPPRVDGHCLKAVAACPAK